MPTSRLLQSNPKSAYHPDFPNASPNHSLPVPVYCPIHFNPLESERFAEIDYRVMGCAYSSQNNLGRLCDEHVYQTDLQQRLSSDGFRNIHTEVPLTVTYESFSKQYFLDLVVEDGALYELKTATTLKGEHEAQLINYALLLGVPRGKLINFRSSKVDGRLISTPLTFKRRQQFKIETRRWRDLSPGCITLRKVMLDLLTHWGSYLDTVLYTEALTHFLGGEDKIARRLTITRSRLPLGTQRFLVHAPGVAFHVTGSANPGDQEPHIRALLIHTELEAIQWINLKNDRIQMITLE